MYNRIAPPNVYETGKACLGSVIVKGDTVIGGLCFVCRTQSRKCKGRGPGRQRGHGSKKRQKNECLGKQQRWQHGDGSGDEWQHGDGWDDDDSWGGWRSLEHVKLCRYSVGFVLIAKCASVA